ncbi:MAG: hypothetical protein ABIF77_03760 [bacterium]
MVLLTDLWLPILLSSVFVFVVSSIIHTVLHWHKSDYGKLPGEEAVLASLRTQSATPGHYFFPACDNLKDLGNPEVIARYEQGPVGFATILPNGMPKMSKSLILWFFYSLIISVFAAYVGHLALSAGSDYRTIFRVTGTVAVLGYAVTYIPDSIWKGLSWRITGKNIVDGIIYGLVTAGTFGWLWPDAG